MSVLKSIQACAFITFIAQLGIATESSVDLGDGTVLSGVTTIEKQLPDSALTVHGITVGVSKLSDVIEKFKGNAVFHEGDAGKSLYLLCYRGKDGTVLAFESSGAMGGAGHVVTNVAVFGPQARYRLVEKCAETPKISRNIEIGGNRLGMTKKKFKKVNGKPSKEQGDLILYSFHASKQTPQGPADITSMLQIRFDGKKASQFSISKIESY